MTRMRQFYKQILARWTNWLLVVFLSLSLVLTACPAPAEQIPVQYVLDDLGRRVAINGTPQRIISLMPSNTEILFALRLGDKVVGVTDWCNYPPEALNKTKVGGFIAPRVEDIVALNPDLILAAHGNPLEVIDTLEGHGLTVFGIRTTDIADLLNDIRRVGEVTDKELEAAILISEMESNIQAITNVTSELEKRPRVFYIVGHDPSLWTAGSGTFIHELIEKAGGVNIFQNITGYAMIGIEDIIVHNPEIIITSVWSYKWALNATELAATNASQTGRIFTCDDDLAQRPGPRLVKGLEWFAHFIHPDRFQEPEK